MEITGNIMKLYKNNIDNVVATNIVPQYYSLFGKKSSTNSEILYALCIFCDFLEYCSNDLFTKVFPEIVKMFLTYVE